MADLMNTIRQAIKPMQHSALRNYIIPGLNSHLIGGGEFGKVRVFEASRSARDFVTPHSHRFDFTCIVLAGVVRNTIYREQHMISQGEAWCMSAIGQVCGADGITRYEHERSDKASYWAPETMGYATGQSYSMTFKEIHSIQFDRGTQVLFFEGPQKVERSCMLEPWVNGKVVPTFKTEFWMFERDA